MKTTNQDNLSLEVAAAAVVAAFTAAAVVAAVAAAAVVAVVAAFTAVVAAFTAAAENNEYKKSLMISIFSLLLCGISYMLTFGSSLNFSPLISWWGLILLLAVMEIYFIFDKEKPKAKENKILFAGKRKLPSLIKSALTIFGVYTVVSLTKDHYKQILMWIGYIGAGIIALALLGLIIYGYLKLNSLKYGKK